MTANCTFILQNQLIFNSGEEIIKAVIRFLGQYVQYSNRDSLISFYPIVSKKKKFRTFLL